MIVYLWPSPMLELHQQQLLSTKHIAFGQHSHVCAIFCTPQLVQTCVHLCTCYRMHPDLICGYHLHEHVEYVLQHDQFPMIRHQFGDLKHNISLVRNSEKDLYNSLSKLIDILSISDHFLTGITVDTVWLAMILSNLVVDEANDVWSDGSFEHSWQADWLFSCFTLFRVNSNQRTSR